MNPHPPADWFEFWVRFVFGALLGVAVGFGTMVGHPWPILLGCAVFFGLLAGWFGDRFWHTVAKWFWW